MHSPPQVEAIVLSGGGGYAAYEVGVMRALATGQVPCAHFSGSPAIFTGTSAGALNAALMVSQMRNGFSQAAGFLENFWRTQLAGSTTCDSGIFRVRGFSFLDLSCVASRPLGSATQLAKDALFFASDWTQRAARFVTSDQPLINRALALFDVSTFFNIRPFMDLISQNVPLDEIRLSKTVLKVAITNWKTGELLLPVNADFKDGVGHRYIAASAAIPGIFPPVIIHGDPHVDGGVVMNTPLKPAIDCGATVLHVIYMDPDVRDVPLHALGNTLEVFDRLWVIQNAQEMNRDIETTRQINTGLRALQKHVATHEHTLDEIQELLRSIFRSGSQASSGNAPFRELTIHRYHPAEDLGSLLGAANLDEGHITKLIQRGFDDALHHNCEAEECVIPPLPSQAPNEPAAPAAPAETGEQSKLGGGNSPELLQHS